ncbi:MAG: hypothetical protein ACKN9F_09950 [Methylomonas sp.]
MLNKTIILTTLLIASGSVMADSTLLEAAGKQLVKDAATTAAPEAVKSVEAAKGVANAPTAAKKQATEALKNAAEEKLKQAAPQELKQSVETLKAAKQLKDAPKSTGEAVKNVKAKAKQKAAEKAVELLR